MSSILAQLESRSRHKSYLKLAFLQVIYIIFFPRTSGEHHMKRAPFQYVSQRDESRTFSIVNRCAEIIYPGIATQSGTPPLRSGFDLYPGGEINISVSADWQGRIWGRTNCSFNSDGTGPSTFGGVNGYGRSCSTGDCNGVLSCLGASGTTPVTLAEFTLATATGQTFYDISLVDGYNIPMAIISLYPESGDPKLTDIPPNLTNPICIGTAALLNLEGAPQDATLGTNYSYPIPLDQSQTYDDVQRWCPWDLQLHPPTKPLDGIYPYPDTTIQRPLFNPCFSACAKYNQPPDCCTGRYNSPNICKPSEYSREAKKVCPDAYSFAFDDQSSTFIIPSGGGFRIMFCPPGRSSNILSTMSAQLYELAATGSIRPPMLADTEGVTLVRRTSSASSSIGWWDPSMMITALFSVVSLISSRLWGH